MNLFQDLIKTYPPQGGFCYNFYMQYKAIISDIDGTLTISHPEAKPTLKVKEAIKKATDKGIIFSVASGRPYPMLSYLIPEVPLVSPIIINNGGEIYDIKNRKIIYESIIPFDLASKILKIAKKYNKFNVDLSREILNSPKSFKKNLKIFKFVIFGLKNNEAEKLIDSVQKVFPTLKIGKAGTYTGAGLVDVYITNGTATKQHAVLKFAELLNISNKEIIAIGDHYNDFPLFMACGLKVAMGNAVEDLKAIADYIAPSVENDGVADVIEKFIL